MDQSGFLYTVDYTLRSSYNPLTSHSKLRQSAGSSGYEFLQVISRYLNYDKVLFNLCVGTELRS